MYVRYFEPFTLVGEGVQMGGLTARARLTDKVKAALFRLGSPRTEPSFFSFWSHQDVNRLGLASGRTLVLYRSCSFTQRLLPHHDFRGTCRSGGPVLCLLFDSAGRLYKIDADQADLLCRKFPPCYADAGLQLTTRRGALLHACGLLLGLGPPDSAARPPSVSEIPDFVGLGPALWEIWRRPVLVVTFSRVLGSSARTVKNLPPSRFLFTVLCFCGPRETPGRVAEYEGLEEAAVLCLDPSGSCCRLSERYAAVVKSRLASTSAMGERLSNRRVATFPLLSSRDRASRIRARREARKKRPRRGAAAAAASCKRICQCPLCRSKEFDLNMAESGPEKLVTTSYTATDLLKILGMWEGDATRALLNRVCELSVAAMDIESRTAKVDLADPRPGPDVPYAEVDSAVLEGHTRFVQKPVMIAHVDGLTLDCPAGDSRRCFLRVEDDSEEAVRLMMKRYLSKILQAQVEASVEKAKLMAPWFERLAAYQRAFGEHCKSWVEQADLEAAQQEEELRQKFRSPAPPQQAHEEEDPGRRQRSLQDSLEALFLVANDEAVPARRCVSSSVRADAPDAEDLVPPWEEEEDDDDDDDDWVDFADGQEAPPVASRGNDDDDDDDGELLFRSALESLRREVPACLLLRRGQLKNDEARRGDGVVPYETLCGRAWPCTLPGQLQSILSRLLREYCVFSFYG